MLWQLDSTDDAYTASPWPCLQLRSDLYVILRSSQVQDVVIAPCILWLPVTAQRWYNWLPLQDARPTAHNKHILQSCIYNNLPKPIERVYLSRALNYIYYWPVDGRVHNVFQCFYLTEILMTTRSFSWSCFHNNNKVNKNSCSFRLILVSFIHPSVRAFNARYT